MYLKQSTVVDHKRVQESMADMKLEQARNECEAWKRLLCIIQEENVRLKTRLSEILEYDVKVEALEKIESFQSRFMKADTIIRLLRNEVADLDRLLKRKMLESGIQGKLENI